MIETRSLSLRIGTPESIGTKIKKRRKTREIRKRRKIKSIRKTKRRINIRLVESGVDLASAMTIEMRTETSLIAGIIKKEEVVIDGGMIGPNKTPMKIALGIVITGKIEMIMKIEDVAVVE